MKNIKKLRIAFFTATILIAFNATSQIKLDTPNTESILYLGTGEKQPLVVGFGGSEGGNAWASDHWKEIRNQFIQKGYAFLAIGYFGCKGTPLLLDKIALEDIHNAIIKATDVPKVDKAKIALLGGSRGADLALLLASYYNDISCVIGIVPSNVVFPGHTDHFSTSCWTIENEELAFVPVNEEAIPFLINGNLRSAFETMLKDRKAEESAVIKVENIQGPILLISATEDEICPSTSMCKKMIERLKDKNFKYNFNHIAIPGNHAAPLSHFDLVFSFLKNNFLEKMN